jgi:hypothetical protein
MVWELLSIRSDRARLITADPMPELFRTGYCRSDRRSAERELYTLVQSSLGPTRPGERDEPDPGWERVHRGGQAEEWRIVRGEREERKAGRERERRKEEWREREREVEERKKREKGRRRESEVEAECNPVIIIDCPVGLCFPPASLTPYSLYSPSISQINHYFSCCCCAHLNHPLSLNYPVTPGPVYPVSGRYRCR